MTANLVVLISLLHVHCPIKGHNVHHHHRHHNHWLILCRYTIKQAIVQCKTQKPNTSEQGSICGPMSDLSQHLKTDSQILPAMEIQMTLSLGVISLWLSS